MQEPWIGLTKLPRPRRGSFWRMWLQCWAMKTNRSHETGHGMNFPKGLWRDIETMQIRSLSSIDGVAKSGQVPWLADSDNKARLRLAGNCQIGEILLKLNRWLLKTSARKTHTLFDTFLCEQSNHYSDFCTCPPYSEWINVGSLLNTFINYKWIIIFYIY